MAALDPARDLQKSNLKDVGIEGIVVDVNDPEKRQRVRIRIPLLHRGLSDKELPWSNQRSLGYPNAGSGVGSANVPDKFAKIHVNFPSGDPHYPEYGPSTTSDDVNKDNELLKEDYPNTTGEIDSHGNRFSRNKATGDITMTHKSGSTISIDGSGNVTIAAAGNLYYASKGDIVLSAAGKLRLHGGGAVDMVGSTINFNSGAGTTPSVPGARTAPQIPNRSGLTNL